MRKPLRFKRKKKRVSFLKRRPFWYAVGLLLLFTFLFWVVVSSPWLKIKEIRIEGTSEIRQENVLSMVKDSLWQGFFGIPQNSILLFNTSDMQEKLSLAFPLISKVSLQLLLPKTLLVRIQEREQVGTWCKDTSCFALDSNGIPFKKVEDMDEYVVFHAEGNVNLGQELVPPHLLSILLGFKKIFEAAGESVQFSTIAFEIGKAGQVKVTSKEGFNILLDTKKSMEWQQTKLELVLKQKIPLAKRGELEYIDLRFGDQAYLKYKD
jgi:cell division septal protein FtsQ